MTSVLIRNGENASYIAIALFTTVNSAVIILLYSLYVYCYLENVKESHQLHLASGFIHSA